MYDNKNRLWIACKDKTIAIYDNSHNFLGYLHFDGSVSMQPDTSLGMAYAITQDKSGTIWIGTKGNGLIEVQPGHSSLHFLLKQYKYSVEDIYSLSHNDIYAVCEDAVGRIWIATFGGGVNYMEQIEGKTRFINYRNKLKNSLFLYVIVLGTLFLMVMEEYGLLQVMVCLLAKKSFLMPNNWNSNIIHVLRKI